MDTSKPEAQPASKTPTIEETTGQDIPAAETPMVPPRRSTRNHRPPQ